MKTPLNNSNGVFVCLWKIKSKNIKWEWLSWGNFQFPFGWFLSIHEPLSRSICRKAATLCEVLSCPFRNIHVFFIFFYISGALMSKSSHMEFRWWTLFEAYLGFNGVIPGLEFFSWNVERNSLRIIKPYTNSVYIQDGNWLKLQWVEAFMWKTEESLQ